MLLHPLAGHSRHIRPSEGLDEDELLMEHNGQYIKRVRHHGACGDYEVRTLFDPDVKRNDRVSEHFERHQLVFKIRLDHEVLGQRLVEPRSLRDEKALIFLRQRLQLLKLFPMPAGRGDEAEPRASVMFFLVLTHHLSPSAFSAEVPSEIYV